MLRTYGEERDGMGRERKGKEKGGNRKGWGDRERDVKKCEGERKFGKKGWKRKEMRDGRKRGRKREMSDWKDGKREGIRGDGRGRMKKRRGDENRKAKIGKVQRNRRVCEKKENTVKEKREKI